MYVGPIIQLLQQTQKNLSGKHAKNTLIALESLGLQIDRATFLQIRKCILDGYNDMFRDFEDGQTLTLLSSSICLFSFATSLRVLSFGTIKAFFPASTFDTVISGI